MGEQTKFRHDKSLSLVDLSIYFPHDNHQKEAYLVLPGDYYTVWTSEKNFIENPKIRKNWKPIRTPTRQRMPAPEYNQ